MNWKVFGGVVAVAAAGAAGQAVRVPAEHVLASPWTGGEGPAGIGETVYGDWAGEFGPYAQDGQLLADDITTTLDSPKVLNGVHFTLVVGGDGVDAIEVGWHLMLYPDAGGKPDLDEPFGDLAFGDLFPPGPYLVEFDDVARYARIELPAGRIWCGVKFEPGESFEKHGQLVGGHAQIGDSADQLYRTDQGLFDFGGAPEANVVLELIVLECWADCDGSGGLDLFDMLCFTNAFNAQDVYGDCDADGAWDLFDFLCFQNGFAAGC